MNVDIHYLRCVEKINIFLNLNSYKTFLFIKQKLEFFLKSVLFFTQLNILKINFIDLGVYVFGFYLYSKKIKFISKHFCLKKKKFYLYVPVNKLQTKLIRYGFLNNKKQPLLIKTLTNLYTKDIVTWLNFFIFGLLNYYNIATNYKKVAVYLYLLFRRLQLYTLANKHNKTIQKIILIQMVNFIPILKQKNCSLKHTKFGEKYIFKII